MSQTPEVYYSNEDNFGKYQYVPLSEVVNRIYLEGQNDASIIKGVKRSLILALAKDGLRELTSDVANDVLSFEVTVPDSLVWPLPQDYMQYDKISLVKRDALTGSFNLYELDIDHKMHIATGYLQDDKADILFDQDGGILEADSSNAIAHPYNRPINTSSHDGNNPTKDTSKYSKYGTYDIDSRRGIIVFSSDLADKEVVIDYVSDGLQAELSDSTVYLHKHLKKPLEDYIYYERLARVNGVSSNRIESARRKYRSSRHKAVLALSDISMTRISKTMESTNKIM